MAIILSPHLERKDDHVYLNARAITWMFAFSRVLKTLKTLGQFSGTFQPLSRRIPFSQPPLLLEIQMHESLSAHDRLGPFSLPSVLDLAEFFLEPLTSIKLQGR